MSLVSPIWCRAPWCHPFNAFYTDEEVSQLFNPQLVCLTFYNQTHRSCHSKAKQGSGCLFKFWLFLQKQASNTQLGLGFVFQAGRQTLEDQHEDQQLSVEEHEEWGPPETGKTTTTMRTKTTTAKTTQKQGCTSQLRVSSSKHFRRNMRTNNTYMQYNGVYIQYM